MKANKTDLKAIYEKACNAYLKAFCEKHGFDYEDASRSWVGDDVGGIAEAGDYVIGMATIRTDIDMDAPEEEFGKWYDYSMRVHAATDGKQSGPNFESWLRGCPRHSEEWFESLEKLRADVKFAETALLEAIGKEDF